MKLNFDKQSFNTAISENIEFVLNLTDAIARKYWLEIKNGHNFNYDDYFEMLTKESAKAFRKAYMSHFEASNANDDDSFRNLIEKFVGGHLLDFIHDLIDNGNKVSKNNLKKSAMTSISRNNNISENFDKYMVQIDCFLIQINILNKKKQNIVICKFIGDSSEISKFQVTTGIIVNKPDSFTDDENDYTLVFSDMGIS